MVSYDAISQAVIEGDNSMVESEVRKALSEGAEAKNILIQGLIGGMSVVGERFGAGEVFLPEVLMSANAMHKGLDIVTPLLSESDRRAGGKVVIGTVAGDIHDIGRRIVTFLLQGNGFDVIDLGVDVPAESFIQAVEEHHADVLGMSALLTTTMPNMGTVIDLLKRKGLRQQVKVIVGGASVTEEFAKSIGADCYAPDAASGVSWVKKTVSKS